METTLRTIRFISQAIVFACLAIVVFSLAPSKKSAYEAALRELDALQTVRYDTLLEHVGKRVIAAEEVERKAVYQLLSGAGFAFKVRDPIDLGDPIIYIEDVFDFSDPKRIDRIVSFIQTGSSIKVLKFVNGKEFVEKLKATPAVASITDATLSFMEFAPPEGSLNGQRGFQTIYLPRTQDGAPTDTVDGKVLMNFFRKGGDDFQVSVDYHATLETLTPNYALKWLKEDYENSYKAIVSGENEAEVMSATVGVLHDIENRTLEKASEFLNGRINAEGDDRLAFIGVSVDSSLAGWLAPLIILSLSVYLLAHLAHLRKFARECANELERFPWVGLIDHWLSKALAVVSLAVFPLVANVLLLQRVWDGSGAAWLGVVLAVLTAICSGFILCSINEIHKEIRSPAAPKQPTTV